MYYCPECGGKLVGDGFSLVLHCENIEPPADAEPDAPPIFCESRDPPGESSA